MDSVSWHDAAAYCNWLSEQEGIPKDQWCYESDKQGVALIASAMGHAGGLASCWPTALLIQAISGVSMDANAMQPVANHLQRTGYRLATEAEWEYACRAGVKTGYSHGEPWEDLLGKYAWFSDNSKSKSHPCGQLKPNDLGLFDMHGNAWEWCDDEYVKGASRRVSRGGSWFNDSRFCRAASRFANVPSSRYFNFGLRVARVPVGGMGK